MERRTQIPLSAEETGVKVGKVLNRHKVGKHFTLSMEDYHFGYARKGESIEREAGLDGICIIRTSERAQTLSAEDTVRTYKSLGQVKQAFRCMKGMDLRVRATLCYTPRAIASLIPFRSPSTHEQQTQHPLFGHRRHRDGGRCTPGHRSGLGSPRQRQPALSTYV